MTLLSIAMARNSFLGILAVTILCVVSIHSPLEAASASKQSTQIKRVGTYLRSAGRFASTGRPEQAAEMFQKAQSTLAAVAQEGVDPRVVKAFSRAQESLNKAHVELSKSGVEVGALPEIEAKPVERPLPNPRQGAEGRFDPNKISFVRDVAPMLANKCGRCHIDGKRGGFSLATYRDLMQGTEGAGRVLVPGDGPTSMIVELIVSGDMPRGGATVTPQETQKLVAWITQGAVFDGESETTNLRNLRSQSDRAEPASEETQPQQPKLTRPNGKETVSFATDVAPILINNCIDCHGQRNPRGGLSLVSFQRLLRGGDSGPIFKAGTPQDSNLIGRITGEEMPRMPLRRPALTPKQIELISTWIREGAAFDGSSPSETLQRVTSLARAERASSEELSEMRAQAAKQNWRLALPDETAQAVATDHFLVMGNLPNARLTEIGKDAERLARQAQDLFEHPAGQPLSKGKITLFALAKRIDFSEFRLMVNRVEAPKKVRSAQFFDIIDSYVVAQLGVSPQEGDTAALAQGVAAAYLAERTAGRLPEWLLVGASRVAAARAAPDDERVQQWRDQLPYELSSVKRPEDLFGDKLSPRTSGILRFGFVEGLLRKPKKLAAVIHAVALNKPIDSAFKREYQLTPEELAPLWFNSARRR